MMRLGDTVQLLYRLGDPETVRAVKAVSSMRVWARTEFRSQGGRVIWEVK